MSELADVRDAAAQALRHKLRGVIPAIWLIDGEIWTEAIDAVVSVVAPQIARPLQARIAELETENDRLRRTSIIDNAYGPGIKVEFDDE